MMEASSGVAFRLPIRHVLSVPRTVEMDGCPRSSAVSGIIVP
jgi:hypothetical protein